MITPFRVDVPETEIADLRRRLRATRWPAVAPGEGWGRGVPMEYLRELVEHWAEDFDWRAAEARLNRWPQIVTEIDSERVHAVHVRSAEPGATPILLTHGWPSSPAEFHDVIGPLVDPVAHGGRAEDAFHVVAPSLPGYGFSGPLSGTGWDTERIGRAWTVLMERLGYDRYVVQGGDWGMPVSLRTALAAPDQVLGVHLTMLVTFPPSDPDDWGSLSESDGARLAAALAFEQDGAGWRKIQSTRPRTLAYGLTDSPVGQLAWIVEKYLEWSAADASPEEIISRDDLLSIVSTYWFTGTAGSSAQLYYDANRLDADFVTTWGGPWKVSAPVGVVVSPADVVRPVRSFAERIVPEITRWTEFEAGGHFAALEQPAAFVDDVRAFLRDLPRAR